MHPINVALRDITIQDRVKRLYQRAFGPGHHVPDADQATARLVEECKHLVPVPFEELLFEPVGNGLCRMNLRPLVQTGLPLEVAAAMFIQTANTFQAKPEIFEAKLDGLARTPEDRAWIEAYKAGQSPALSHSEAYHAAYHPAYRVIREDYARAFPVILRMAQMQQGIIAIDGPCASGKSTLAQLLGDLFSVTVLHLDDFFLRPEQRTPERLAEPGGNFDRERFVAEALTPLAQGKPFTFRPYNCAHQVLADPVSVVPTPVSIVEGVYCQHPDLRDVYALRTFLTIDPQLQQERLLARNGEALLKRFIAEWIPMENRYFEAFDVQAKSDVVLAEA